MIWAILVLLGVPLWLCAVAILVLVLRNRALRKRPDDISLRMRMLPDGRWRRGHGLWAHDVLAFRGSPAAWAESLQWVSSATPRELTAKETRRARRLDQPVAVTLAVGGRPAAEAITAGAHLPRLLGPFAATQAPVSPLP